jgi:membrane protease YdiL (CAAX protease family)
MTLSPQDAAAALRATPATLPWWPDGAYVALLLAFPVGATALLIGGYRAIAEMPAQPRAMLAAWFIYSLASWAAVGLTWRWSRRRGTSGAVFDFRKPDATDLIVAVLATAVGVLVLFPLSQWLASAMFATRLGGMRFDLREPHVAAMIVFWAVVTAPYCEEVLFRGLAVTYLRARHWPAWAIGAASTLAFAAIHLPYFGVGGAIFILLWSGMVVAIRLWRDHLTPGWIVHVLNNAIAYLLVPFLVSMR